MKKQVMFLLIIMILLAFSNTSYGLLSNDEDYFIESLKPEVINISFSSPGYKTVNISLPNDIECISGNMSITGLGPYPENLSLDIGDDDSVDWMFSGRMGYQTSFATHQDMASLLFDTAGSQTVNITLPTSSISSASLSISINNSYSAYDYNVKIGNKLFWHQTTLEPFTPAYQIGACGGKAHSIVTGDINNDSNNDIVVGSEDGYVYLLINDNDTFETQNINIGSPVYSVAITDIDNDEDKDIVASSRDMYVIRNNDGMFEKYRIVTGASDDIVSISVDDLDRNGYKDIVGASKDKHLYIATNFNGSFTLSSINLESSLNSVAIGDMDNDNNSDIVAASGNKIYVCLSNNTTFDVSSFTVNASIYSVKLGDINNDDMLDIVGAGRETGPCKGRFTVCINNNGTFETTYIAAGDYPLYSLALGDVTRNGYLDIVGTGYDSNIYYVLNNGTLNQSSSVSTGGRYMYSAALGDMDSDTDLDVICGDSDGNIFLSKNTVKTMVETTNFTSELQSYIDSCSTYQDSWGNTLCHVPVTVESKYAGSIILSNLSITYNYTAPVPGFPDKIKEYIASYRGKDEYCNVTLPLNFSSESEGKIKIVIEIMYLIPPRLTIDIPSTYSLDEDTTAVNLINLEDYFWDEKDDGKILVFEASYQEDKTKINAVVNGSYLSFTTPTKDWYGSMSFRVRAIDSDGLSQESNLFTVKVDPVNDPPVYLGGLHDKTIGIGQSWSINMNEYFMDIEGSELVYTCNYPEINIEGSVASWAWSDGDKNLRDVVFTASDDEWNTDSTPIILQYRHHHPPAYLDGLTDAEVVEDTTWGVNLNAYFNTGDYGATFECNDPYVVIDGSVASWTPREDSKSLKNVVFTAIDNHDVNLTATSNPINLIFIWVNDPPTYLGGLTNVTAWENQTWNVDLNKYFTDEEKPEQLTFVCNSDKITINPVTKIASWTPKKGDMNLTIVFTAIDADDENLTTASDHITLIFMGKNSPPTAYIDSITPVKAREGETIMFKGYGVDDGEVVKYVWMINDEIISTLSSFSTSNLSVGTHTIRFKCQDNTGLWSEEKTATITIMGKSHDENYITSLIYILSSVTLIALGVVLNVLGRKYIPRRRR